MNERIEMEFLTQPFIQALLSTTVPYKDSVSLMSAKFSIFSKVFHFWVSRLLKKKKKKMHFQDFFWLQK